MSQRFAAIAVSTLLAALLLGTAWLGVSQAAHLTGAPAGAARRMTPPPELDDGWLKLVRGRHTAGGTQAPTGPTLNVNLTDGAVAGYVPAPSAVMITITRPGQVSLAAIVAPALDPGGYFYAASLTLWSWAPAELLPGDTVWVSQGAAVVSLTVPALTALAEPEVDRIFGAAPGGAALLFYLLPFDDPSTAFTTTATALGDGSYEVNWSPGADLRRRDGGYALLAFDSARQVYRRYVAPYLQARLDLYQLSGWVAPNSVITVTAHPTGQPPFTHVRSSDAQGFFSLADAYYYPTDWAPPGIRVWPGDVLTVEASGQVISTTLLPVSAAAVLADGVVQVESLPGLKVEVTHYGGPPPHPSAYGPGLLAPAATVTGTLDPGGVFSASVPMAPTDFGTAVVTGADGHATAAWYALPYLSLRLGASVPYGGPTAWGQVSAAMAPLTLTVAGPSGYDKVRLALVSNDAGRFVSYGSPPDAYYAVESGDTVTVTSPHGSEIAVAVPPLSAGGSAGTDIVSGTAPAGAALRVSLFHFTGAGLTEIHRLTVTATLEGAYAADFGPLADIGVYDAGEVEYRTPAGHSLVRPFTILDACLPSVLRAQVGGNGVEVAHQYDCGEALLRLSAPGGAVKAQLVVQPGTHSKVDLVDATWRPVIIEPGDRLDVFGPDPAGGAWAGAAPVLSLVVPPLTVEPQAATDTLTGQALPGALLSFLVLPDSERREFLPGFTATAGLDGQFNVPLPAAFDLLPGDRVMVETLVEYTRFFAFGSLPAVRVNLYDSYFSGLLDPLQAFTLSLTLPSAEAIVISGTAASEGTFAGYVSPLAAVPGSAVSFEAEGLHLAATLPTLTAVINPAAARITGVAPPNSRLLVALFDPYGGPVTQWVTATGTGHYTATFPARAPLDGAAAGAVTHYDPSGLHTRLAWTQPHWRVTLGDPCVSGGLGAAAPATLTLRSGSEVLTADSLFIAPNGDFWACFARPAAIGDVLAADQLGLTRTFTVPVLTAAHDWARGVLEGQAPAGARVMFEFALGGSFSTGMVIRDATAGADGSYGIDTSDLRLRLGPYHLVSLRDSYGNLVRLPISIWRTTLYFPAVYN